MNWTATTECCAFLGHTLVARGALQEVAPLCKQLLDAGTTTPLMIFNNSDGTTIEVDFRGSVADVVARLPTPAPVEGPTALPPEELRIRAPRGRPRLGVVAREVTLLPRHWDWLKSQPGGASVALRKLVEGARKTNAHQDQLRAVQNAAYRFMSTMAGSLAGFEEATRALFAGDTEKFVQETEHWPEDVRTHARFLVSQAFG